MATCFDILTLADDYAHRVGQFNKGPLSWVEYMHDRNLGYRHQLQEIAKRVSQGGRWRYDVYGGRWRLFSVLPDYCEPWKQLPWEAVEDECHGCESECPLAEYLKHLCRRYEGEVAVAWEQFTWHAGPPPREKRLWHPQFSKKAAQVSVLAALAARGKTTPGTRFEENEDLLAVGSTTIVRFAADPKVGHWRLSGGAVTLMELFHRLGERFSAQELFCWYYHAPKLTIKRAHPWGSQDVRDAAHLRFKTYGHYGHRRGRDAAVGAN